MAVTVHHDAAKQCFVAEVEGQRCVCDYRLFEHDGEVMLTNTYVPAALRGRGVAAELVAAALAWAAEQNLNVIPACSYVRSYMRRHPATQRLLAAGDSL